MICPHCGRNSECKPIGISGVISQIGIECEEEFIADENKVLLGICKRFDACLNDALIAIEHAIKSGLVIKEGKKLRVEI